MWEFITEVSTLSNIADNIQKNNEVSDEDLEKGAKLVNHLGRIAKHGKDDPITAPHRIAKALDNAANYTMDGRIATHLKDVDPHRTAALAAALAAGAGAVHLARKLRKAKHNK
jgi:hypothetical protein